MCAAFHWARGRPAAEMVVMCSPFAAAPGSSCGRNGPLRPRLDNTTACPESFDDLPRISICHLSSRPMGWCGFIRGGSLLACIRPHS